MLEQLESLSAAALAELETINSSDALREWESKYLGKKGSVIELVRSTGKLPAEERPAFGKRANEIKTKLEAAHADREKLIHDQELAQDLEGGEVDITLPGRPRQVGGLHPSTQTLRNFYSIWADMGFQVYRSRDVEDDLHNFELLNFPPHHPARDMQDTFYTTTPDVILRTHTSPGQIRAMQEFGEGGTQPIRVILPGMCYRFEQITARSEVQFHQVEGLAVGRNIRMSDLKGTIAAFARRMFGEAAKVRYRASYFPFTEPSMEVDVECFLCGGEGCRVCKYAGWLEIAGSGMVHPTVLRNGGYDPTQWSGFAFGMGPERITMLKHGIEDIRYFWSNDLRFLEQF
ncbi:MAG: phenylalanine--tRNA ligase subunit alpha [Burkholderiales bacterium]|nr:phenylalanine--tRNA ligase subunit alpha [Anaerolineae bacterium]